MKKSPNDYRGQSKKLEAKNKTRAKAYAKKDAGRKNPGTRAAKAAESVESRYADHRPSGPSDKAYKLLGWPESSSACTVNVCVWPADNAGGLVGVRLSDPSGGGLVK